MSIGLECEDFDDGSSGREAMRPVAAAIRLCDRSTASVARETVRAALITRAHVALGKAVVAEQDEVRREPTKRLFCGDGDLPGETRSVVERGDRRQRRRVVAALHFFRELCKRRSGRRLRVLGKQRQYHDPRDIGLL